MIDYNSAADPMGTGAPMARRTVSAFFDYREDADASVAALVAAGIPQSNIRLTQGKAESTDTMADDSSASGESKGFFETLGDLFFPDDDRAAYAEGLNRGGHLVTATGLDDTTYDIALDILDDEGAVDMDERSASWESEGWSSGKASGGMGMGAGMADPLSGSTGYQDDRTGTLASVGQSGSQSVLTDGDTETVQVVEEQLRVGKRDANAGGVRVRSYVVEEPVSETVNLRQERVEIERRPVDRGVVAGEAAFADRTIEAQEYREEAVVSKEARVVEEIGLRRTASDVDQTITDTVRRTEVEIEDDRDEADTTPTSR